MKCIYGKNVRLKFSGGVEEGEAGKTRLTFKQRQIKTWLKSRKLIIPSMKVNLEIKLSMKVNIPGKRAGLEE